MIESEAYSAKAARAGKDIGKKGKNFEKIAKKAAERYGSEERGKKVAGAILKKLRMKEEAEQLGEKAPPGKKFERMVKHIKKGYESGGLTKQEKGIAYATAWKSYNKEEVEHKVGDKIQTKVGGKWISATITKSPHPETGNYGVRFKVGSKTMNYVSSPNQIKKIAKEEVEQIDEAIPKSTSIALVHTDSKKIVAKGNKNQMMKKMKELNSKEKGSHHLGSTYRGKVGDTFGEEVEQVKRTDEDTNMSIKFTEFRSRLDEASYMGKGNHKPGWMLRADPELARKFKEIEDRKKNMNSLMKKYGGKTGDEIAKMKKEEVEQVDERNKENKVKKNAYVSSIIQKKLHPSVLPSLKYGRQELKKEEIEQVDELKKSTLGSYIKKASHDVATKSALTRHFATKSRDEKEKQNYTQARKDDETSNKLFNKSWKRRQGIAKAVDRLTKKEVEIS